MVAARARTRFEVAAARQSLRLAQEGKAQFDPAQIAELTLLAAQKIQSNISITVDSKQAELDLFVKSETRNGKRLRVTTRRAGTG